MVFQALGPGIYGHQAYILAPQSFPVFPARPFHIFLNNLGELSGYLSNLTPRWGSTATSTIYG